MVLYKRKVVQALPPPDVDPESNPDVWYIQTTGEFFLEYEDYLKRMDFYNQHRFVCEISGHSNLSYWEALESETNEAREVDEAFPESLKEPVLRRLQFSTTSRLDHLVDEVYDAFKSDFYPGEYAFALIKNDKLEVVIREKAQFNAIQMPDGEIRPAYAKYRVEMIGHGREGQEDVVDGLQLTRDRKRFSKSMLRTFMKNSLSREPWSGAPWLVKAKYAKKYRIDTNIPPHLQRKNGLSEAELAATQAKKLKEKRRMLQLAERAKISREKEDQKEQARREREEQREREKRERELLKRPPSTEDLDLIPMTDPPSQRPKLKIERAMPMEWIGVLLQTWSFFNVFHETLVLSLFTFDEYICALQYTSHDLPCELFVELNCALLKLVVSNDSPEFAIDLPVDFSESEKADRTLSHEKVSEVKSEEHTADDEEQKPRAMSTRSSRANKTGNEDDAKKDTQDSNADEDEDEDDEDDEDEDDSESIRILNSLSKWRDGSWKERLRRRLFISGGMELIILNLLKEVAYVSKWTDFCHEIIDTCLPVNEQASVDALRSRFARLSPVQKLRILDILIELVGDSAPIRERIEFCMEESTRIRRERLETHKEHKALQEQIRVAEEEKRELMPPEPETLPIPESKDDGDGEQTEQQRLEEARKAWREEAESRLLRTSSAFKKVVQTIENAQKGIQRCILALKSAEIELRMLDCQRFRVLGRDRFYNRYWWLEGNGLPTDLGRYQYLMGRLWVQGPSEEDLEVFVKDGKAAYGEITLAERKDMEVEDREPQLNEANEWGYYDDPEDIGELLHWLGTKGTREPRLRKDLDLRRTRVEAPMVARRKYLGLDNEKERDDSVVADSRAQSRAGDDETDVEDEKPVIKQQEDGDDDEEEEVVNSLRRSSRQRKRAIAQVEAGHIARDFRFLSWRNTAASALLGKSHYESGYKKSGGDLLSQKSQNFASPASAAASVTTSAKASPQPPPAGLSAVHLANVRVTSSAESSPAPADTIAVATTTTTTSSNGRETRRTAAAAESSQTRKRQLADTDFANTDTESRASSPAPMMVTRKQAKKRHSAPSSSFSARRAASPSSSRSPSPPPVPDRRLTRRSAAALDDTPASSTRAKQTASASSTPDRRTSGYGTRSTRSAVANSATNNPTTTSSSSSNNNNNSNNTGATTRSATTPKSATRSSSSKAAASSSQSDNTADSGMERRSTRRSAAVGLK